MPINRSKVTKVSPKYPVGEEPNFIIPKEYCGYRYALGRIAANQTPLVAICMNPSAAKEESSDMTINRIINMSKRLGMEGWVVFNLYPERATQASDMDNYNVELSKKNIHVIRTFLLENNIKEVLGAWGNDQNLKALGLGRIEILKMLSDIGVKVFYFGTLTKDGNPRHPLQRQEKWDLNIKNYL